VEDISIMIRQKTLKKFINLLPLQVKSVNSFGKFIWFEFNNTKLTMWNTLGMSGWW
jgi:formamidopyrimidine-DNA glycosylase